MTNTNTPLNGKDLFEVVQAAVNSNEFRNLNQQVQNAIRDTSTQIARAADKAQAAHKERARKAQQAERAEKVAQGQRVHYASQGAHRQPNAYTTQYSSGGQAIQTNQVAFLNRPQAQQTALNPYVKKSYRNVTGIVQAVLGFGLSAAALICGVVVLPFVLMSAVEAGEIGVMLFFGLLAAAGVAIGVTGIGAMSFSKRFARYAAALGTRTFCEIDEIAQFTGIPRARIVKDLKKMIAKGLFPQGCIDPQEKYLFVSQETFSQYLGTEQQRQTQQLAEAQKARKREALPLEAKQIIAEGAEYITFIKACNDKLPGEEISAKLDRLETIVTRIFKQVERDPSVAPEMRRFMTYYLPTTKKLLQVYCDLDKEPIASDKMMATKHEIERTLDTIEEAFENMLDSFFSGKALDVSSDISVLNAMFAREGLTGGISTAK